MLLSNFGTIGSERALLRFLPIETQEDSESLVLGIAYVTTVIGSGCVALALYLLAPTLTEHTLDNPLLTDIVRVFAIVLPFYSISLVTLGVFRSLEVLKYQVFVRDMATPAIKLVFIGVALAAGYSLFGVAAAIGASVIVVLLISIYLLFSRTRVRPALDGYSEKAQEYYNFTLPLTMKDVGGLVMSRVDILMIGFLLSEQAVGIYNIAFLLSGLLVFPVRAANQLVPPIISRLYEDGDREQLQSVYSTLARWVLTVTLLPMVGILVYRQGLLAIFGSSFTAGGTALIFLSIGYIVKSAGGPSGYVLMLTDHQYLSMINQWIMALVNLGLNYYLILRYGFVGAAIATSFTMVFINVVRVVEVQYTENLFPYTLVFLKPVAAVSITAAVLLPLNSYLSGVASMVSGAIVGTIVYVCCLYLFGLEDIDEVFLSSVFEQLTSGLR
jgi:O-antigen/teichoic acid export membrane protein